MYEEPRISKFIKYCLACVKPWAWSPGGQMEEALWFHRYGNRTYIKKERINQRLERGWNWEFYVMSREFVWDNTNGNGQLQWLYDIMNLVNTLQLYVWKKLNNQDFY